MNLRGGREHGSWPLEREACEAAGIKLTEFVVRSRGAPDRETILSAAEFFEKLDYPVLVHCKSGADRAGFMAALFLLVHEKRPLDEAMDQLESMGYKVNRWTQPTIYFGGTHTVGCSKDGQLGGAGDRRRGGVFVKSAQPT